MAETTIFPRPDGPYKITGSFKIVDADGNEIPLPGDGTAVSLCRCGHSENKPFCDGTHKKIGFKAPSWVGPKD